MCCIIMRWWGVTVRMINSPRAANILVASCRNSTTHTVLSLHSAHSAECSTRLNPRAALISKSSLATAPSHWVLYVITAVITSVFRHLDPYFYSSILKAGAGQSGRAGAKGRPQLPCHYSLTCPWNRSLMLFVPRSEHSDGSLVYKSLNCTRQRQISVGQRKTDFCGNFPRWNLRVAGWRTTSRGGRWTAIRITVIIVCNTFEQEFVSRLTPLRRSKHIVHHQINTAHTDI